MIEDEIKQLRCAIEEISAQQQAAINNLVTVTTHLVELLQTKGGAAAAEQVAEEQKPAPKKKAAAKKKAPAKPKTNGKTAPKQDPTPDPAPEPESTPEPEVSLTSAEVKGVLMQMVKGGHSKEAKELKEGILPGASVDTLEPGDPVLHKIHEKAMEFLANA